MDAIRERGYEVIPSVFSNTQVEQILIDLERTLQRDVSDVPIRSRLGQVYAARNLLSLWRPALSLWHSPPLPDLLHRVLGPKYGLVRGLYFDKPPERTWSLPWHKDMTIAVRDHRDSDRTQFKPTTKAGVPHVEAPLHVLQQMLTVRIHLDDMQDDNGPLRVIPESHKEGKEIQTLDSPVTIHARRGDVLVIRPLVTHCSVSSLAGCTRHRRILHLEFAHSPALPHNLQWHAFIAGPPSDPS